MSYQPQFGDIAHLAHVELHVPDLEKSVAFFKNIVGLHEVGRAGESVYMRAWAGHQLHTLQLTRHSTSGMGHAAFRTRSADVLELMAENLVAHGHNGVWLEPEFGQGRTFRFETPDGHHFELIYEIERFALPAGELHPFKNQPDRYLPWGIAPKRLDHLNLLAREIRPCREFCRDLLGMRVTEQIVFEDGEVGSWHAANSKSYELVFVKDTKGARGRFPSPHLLYGQPRRRPARGRHSGRERHRHRIRSPQAQHRPEYLPLLLRAGGNRVEIGSGGYLILDPDWKPVVWSREERMKGQAWGLQTVQHISHLRHAACRLNVCVRPSTRLTWRCPVL